MDLKRSKPQVANRGCPWVRPCQSLPLSKVPFPAPIQSSPLWPTYPPNKVRNCHLGIQRAGKSSEMRLMTYAQPPPQ